MKITRKFNLARIHQDLKYETVTIEAEGESVGEIMHWINDAWRVYAEAIRDGKVE